MKQPKTLDDLKDNIVKKIKRSDTVKNDIIEFGYAWAIEDVREMLKRLIDKPTYLIRFTKNDKRFYCASEVDEAISWGELIPLKEIKRIANLEGK